MKNDTGLPSDILHELPGSRDQGRGGQSGLERQRDVFDGAGGRQRPLLPDRLLQYLVHGQGHVHQQLRDGASWECIPASINPVARYSDASVPAQNPND